MRVVAGTRIGFWNNNATKWDGNAFIPKGYYRGEICGDFIPGTVLEQHLEEGVVRFRVGVLFRPDLNKNQRLETILIFETYVPEMWRYNDWDDGLIAVEN